MTTGLECVYLLISDLAMTTRLTLRRSFFATLVLCIGAMFIWLCVSHHKDAFHLAVLQKYNLTGVMFSLRQSGDVMNNETGTRGEDQGADIKGLIQGQGTNSETGLNIHINIDISREQLLKALVDIIGPARNQNIDLKPSVIIDSKETLLTLFTTVSKTEATKPIFMHTLQNWAKFKPVFTPVLFTNDVSVESKTVAIEAGWTVLNVSKSAPNGLPILKYMFKDAMATFNSKYYGFANADILFTHNLVTTLTVLDYSNLSKNRTFMSGQRTNVVGVSDTEAASFHNISTASQARGTLFQTSAEDYFITGKGYNWNEGPDVVIGSLGYDNWLVFEARAEHNSAIDGTQTVLAVHQSLNNTSLYQSHLKDTALYNKGLIRTFLRGLDPPYPKGFTECLELYTMIEDGHVVVRERKVNDYCKVG